MIKGGVADKLGNAYEAHWALLEALRVLRGQAEEIRLEPFNEHAAGFEFRVTESEQNFWHQCKRRLVAGSWTINALASEGVLQHFADKLGDKNNECVFVSIDPAAAFKALVDKALLVESSKDFSDSLSQIEIQARKQLNAVWAVDPETELSWLRRCRVETVSEYSIRRELKAICQLTFAALPELAIERLWAFLGGKLTHTITTNGFRSSIDSLGIGWKAHLDETIGEKIEVATDEYLKSVPPTVAGLQIETADVTEAVRLAVADDSGLTIVAGAAGSGKSVAMARIVAAARAKSWPVLALRIDRYLSVQTVEELGKALVRREESPVGVLGNRYGGKDCLLVVDQVDAVSEASGRSGRIRDLLFQLIADSHFYPRMRVVMACRSYDLDHDSRLKQLSASASTKSVQLRPLDWEESVKPILEHLGLGQRKFSEREKRILSVAINLQLFANIVTEGEALEGEISSGRLFDKLLEIRAREFRQNGISWTPQAALGKIAQSMSESQELTASESLLSPFPGAVDALSSHGLITAIGGKIQFGHESFFDNVFSSHFLTTGSTVLALLQGDEQRLFRRTQVRQIFSRLRDQGAGRTYLSNLGQLMNANDVRYLVKDAVSLWLADVEEPTDAERAVVEKWYEPGHRLEKIARTVFNGKGWLPVLIKSGLLSRWVNADGEAKEFCFSLLQKNSVRFPDLVSTYLRAWWADRSDRTVELLSWFSRLYADGPIGPLEDLYREAVGKSPSSWLTEKQLEEIFELGSWAHNDRELGARVLGMWLRRWMAEFPTVHPFGERVPSNSSYWIKEISEKVPVALLDAVLPCYVEALRRERAALDAGPIDWPSIHIPMRDDEDSYVKFIADAFRRVAKQNPAKASELLSGVPSEEATALYFYLRAIAANGEALGQLLPKLLHDPQIFKIGEHDGEWLPFAEAARAAFSYLPERDRAKLERAVMLNRPEYDWACEYLKRHRQELNTFTADPERYTVYQLSKAGEVERAILTTIGVSQLSPLARYRLAELDRKFPGAPLPESHGMRGGWVRSPIALNKAAFMTDRQWLSAMRRYANDEDHTYLRDQVVGGARQLASVLQAQTKTDTERFVALLEGLPASINPSYAEAILSGVREGTADDALAARAIQAAIRLNGANLNRTISWLVEKHPDAASDSAILTFVIAVAEVGTASDTAVRTVNPNREPKTAVRDLLGDGGDLRASGINGERGAAYEALAKVLWVDKSPLEAIAGLVERRVDDEPLSSVRMCMIHTINSIAKHDTSRGLRLLKQMAARDLSALLSHAGHHVLNWAVYSYPDEFRDLVHDLSCSADQSLRALGLFLDSGLAVRDDASENVFVAKFPGDTLRRQVGAFRAARNLSSDKVGDRAARWLVSLFFDPEKIVRDESSHIRWDRILDGVTDRTDLVRTYIQSPAFAEHSDRLMMALGDRVDRSADVTLDALKRVLALSVNWQAKGRHGNFSTIHHLGRVLVELYRAVDGDSERERELLDLFDLYLATDVYDMQSEISAYERH